MTDRISVTADISGAVELRLETAGWSMATKLDHRHLTWLIRELQKHATPEPSVSTSRKDSEGSET